MMALETPRVPVSWGDLIDKVTILEIKRERIADADALANVRHELALLRTILATLMERSVELMDLKAELKLTNEKLWEIEDCIRQKEAAKEFDAGFIELARAVYKTNDLRSALKRTINARLGSEIREEKSYTPYSA